MQNIAYMKISFWRKFKKLKGHKAVARGEIYFRHVIKQIICKNTLHYFNYIIVNVDKFYLKKRHLIMEYDNWIIFNLWILSKLIFSKKKKKKLQRKKMLHFSFVIFSRRINPYPGYVTIIILIIYIVLFTKS